MFIWKKICNEKLDNKLYQISNITKKIQIANYHQLKSEKYFWLKLVYQSPL